MHPWEHIADEISKAGWSYGYVKQCVALKGWLWTVDAHRSDGHRYASQIETLLTAFIELQKVVWEVDAKLK